VVVVAGTVVVVAAMVVPVPSVVEGSTTFAIAGSAVVLRTTPATREAIAPISTERRGPRPRREERPEGSPEFLCPCVIFVMYQLSETNSKVPPTISQLPPKSHVWNCECTERNRDIEHDLGDRTSWRLHEDAPWREHEYQKRAGFIKRSRNSTLRRPCIERQMLHPFNVAVERVHPRTGRHPVNVAQSTRFDANSKLCDETRRLSGTLSAFRVLGYPPRN
jgi:hypothetical protein